MPKHSVINAILKCNTLTKGNKKSSTGGFLFLKILKTYWGNLPTKLWTKEVKVRDNTVVSNKKNITRDDKLWKIQKSLMRKLQY